MRKTVQIGISSLLIGFFIGCAAMTPENSFYDSKIRSIEVDAVKIENQFSDEVRMEKFAKYIIIELNKKGYDTIKGNIDVPTFIEGFSPDGYAKKISKKIKADAIILLDCKFLRKEVHFYKPESKKGHAITHMVARYFLYNQNGERLLELLDMNKMPFKMEESNAGGKPLYSYLISEDELIKDMAKRLLWALPPYGMEQQKWEKIMEKRKHESAQ